MAPHSGDAVLTIGYMGSVAHHLSVGLPQNIATGLDSTSTPIFRYKAAVYRSIDTIFSGGNSNYNSMQISLNKHLSRALGSWLPTLIARPR